MYWVDSLNIYLYWYKLDHSAICVYRYESSVGIGISSTLLAIYRGDFASKKCRKAE